MEPNHPTIRMSKEMTKAEINRLRSLIILGPLPGEGPVAIDFNAVFAVMHPLEIYALRESCPLCTWAWREISQDLSKEQLVEFMYHADRECRLRRWSITDAKTGNILPVFPTPSSPSSPSSSETHNFKRECAE